MASLNKVFLIGNLTRDPEIRYTPKGSAVAEIGLAVSRKFKGDDGQMREESTFVDITLWGKLAELAGQYLKKGSPIFVEGRLQLESWDDKQTGQKRTKMKVVGEMMQFLGSKREGDSGTQSQSRPASGQRPQGRPQQQTQLVDDVSGSGMEDDDIPFAKPHHLMVGGV